MKAALTSQQVVDAYLLSGIAREPKLARQLTLYRALAAAPSGAHLAAQATKLGDAVELLLAARHQTGRQNHFAALGRILAIDDAGDV